MTEISGRPRPRCDVLGWLAGIIMTLRPLNRLRNRWSVQRLELEPDHQVLEIGVGPGLASALVARRLVRGRLVGCDHSALMLRTASRRVLSFVRAGRVELHQLDVNQLVSGRCGIDGPFDRIFGVNVAMFFDDPVAIYAGLSRLLAPTGRIQITHQPRVGDTSREGAERAALEIAEAMRQAGLTTELFWLTALTPPAVCVVGARS